MGVRVPPCAPGTASSVVCACLLSLAAPVLAHHSHGDYDLTKWTVMEGTVRQVVFIIPHSIVYLDVKGQKGETEKS